MKLLKYLSTLPLVFTVAICAHAQTIKNHLTPPFANAQVSPNTSLEVDYSFDPHQQQLYCYDSKNVQQADVTWTYKDAVQKAMLPITLKDDAKFPGQWADPKGKLFLTNASNNQTMSVTCAYYP